MRCSSHHVQHILARHDQQKSPFRPFGIVSSLGYLSAAFSLAVAGMLNAWHTWQRMLCNSMLAVTCVQQIQAPCCHHAKHASQGAALSDDFSLQHKQQRTSRSNKCQPKSQHKAMHGLVESSLPCWSTACWPVVMSLLNGLKTWAAGGTFATAFRPPACSRPGHKVSSSLIVRQEFIMAVMF